MAKIRVLLVDDHVVLRQGLQALLERSSDIEVVGEASDGRTAFEEVRRCSPNVVLMDILMPGMDGLTATRRIVASYPNVTVLILSQRDEERYVLPVLSAGASGYLLKTTAADELVKAIRTVYDGGCYLPPGIAKTLLSNYCADHQTTAEPKLDTLTERECEVLRLVANGHTSQEIADLLSISPRTVMTHRANIYSKLGTHNLADLIKCAIRKGLIELQS